jgi:hypothetical protein
VNAAPLALTADGQSCSPLLKRAQIGGRVWIFCGQCVDIADLDVDLFYAGPFGARTEEPIALADDSRSVKCIARDKKLHALTAAQVGSDNDALLLRRFREASEPRSDHPGNSDKAGHYGCGAGAPAHPV